ncbi:hypothetical protein [Sphingobium sp. HWE2-09]|uniref:hypothetical protein n=1 Tax=Sphingobium sp. HWE2-09 TaxID=3108390 RepID=UPI002DC6F587|nr:hypothetical protein [Sphingobium sp. HWE2-09]
MGYAYSKIAEYDVIETGSSHTSSIGKSSAESLSKLERSVIQLSMQDTPRSIQTPSKWGARLANLLGREQPNHLASEPLEELRRFAIMTRVRGEADAAMLHRLADAGYSAGQTELAIDLVLRHSAQSNKERTQTTGWLLILVVAVFVFLAMQATLEETMVSIIVASLAFATLASLVAPREQQPR